MTATLLFVDLLFVACWLLVVVCCSLLFVGLLVCWLLLLVVVFKALIQMMKRRGLMALVGLGVFFLVRWLCCAWRADPSPGVPRVVFSDIDGTLAHYAWQLEGAAEIVPGSGRKVRVKYHYTGVERECRVLPSQTSGLAFISKRTIELIRKLRSRGVVFVLITGARSSTYMKRRQFLPEADYEVFESGGRIWHHGREDLAWAQLIHNGSEMRRWRSARDPKTRPGPLWTVYRRLLAEGWQVDANGYETQFRIRLPSANLSDRFGAVLAQLDAEGLAHAWNLGHVDVFPKTSGKANAARHVLQQLGVEAHEAVALFDDHNDIELGRLCGRGFLPGITDPRVSQQLAQQPHWQVSSQRGPLGTEEALEAVLNLLPGD